MNFKTVVFLSVMFGSLDPIHINKSYFESLIMFTVWTVVKGSQEINFETFCPRDFYL
ncbi:rCG63441 [Rattus norvegicus]|uniref:RCG63441 n=1 Tax=Rattus norvegicus TaxID=10116 RepID=A6HAI0_RAT|nr:rCG63441 [Rattus norvegicus]